MTALTACTDGFCEHGVIECDTNNFRSAVNQSPRGMVYIVYHPFLISQWGMFHGVGFTTFFGRLYLSSPHLLIRSSSAPTSLLVNPENVADEIDILDGSFTC